jgi:hypothetical protein
MARLRTAKDGHPYLTHGYPVLDQFGQLDVRFSTYQLYDTAGWTHYSIFEVHDNVTGDEIRELEGLLLRIFRHDPRIELGENSSAGRC